MTFEYYAAENPDKTVVQYHPGLIMGTGSNDLLEPLVKDFTLDPDDISLAADFAVWAASTEAKCLHGRFVWASWDVDELKAIKEEIAASLSKFTIDLIA